MDAWGSLEWRGGLHTSPLTQAAGERGCRAQRRANPGSQRPPGPVRTPGPLACMDLQTLPCSASPDPALGRDLLWPEPLGSSLSLEVVRAGLCVLLGTLSPERIPCHPQSVSMVLPGAPCSPWPGSLWLSVAEARGAPGSGRGHHHVREGSIPPCGGLVRGRCRTAARHSVTWTSKSTPDAPRLPGHMGSPPQGPVCHLPAHLAQFLVSCGNVFPTPMPWH